MRARVTLVQTCPEPQAGMPRRREVVIIDGQPHELERLAVLEAKRLHGPGTVWKVIDRITAPY